MRMALMAVVGMIAAATPACAQNRHNYDALENRRLDEVQQQRADDQRITAARARAKPAMPSEAEKKAAAWRADHLSCVTSKGRTAAQYAAECRSTAPP